MRETTHPAQFAILEHEMAAAPRWTRCGGLLRCLLALVALSGFSLLAFSASPVRMALAAAPNDLSSKSSDSAFPVDSPLASPACSPDWQIVPSPNAIKGRNSLYGVAALSANDVWAVGSYNNGVSTKTLTMHWNGIAWSVVPSLNPGSNEVNLYSVTVISANDVWAVGDYYSGSLDQTLTMHWNGSLWSLIPSPYPGTSLNILTEVEAVSSNDVWAVGYYSNGGAGRTLIVHWNGSAWSVVTSPNQGTDHNTLSAIAALSPSDIWAVGSYYNGSVDQTLTMHWNGATWDVVASPNHSTTEPNRLYGVTAISSDDVWAVGSYSDGTSGLTLALHWTGTSWAIISSPNASTFSNDLEQVAAVSPNDVWAVGSYNDNGSLSQTLTLHWNGSVWEIVSSPNFGAGANVLSGIAVVSSNDVWAAGYYYNGSVNHTLVQHWNGSAWSTITSPNAGVAGASQLQAVEAVSSNDVWAVGYYFIDAANQTLVEHWNGSDWNIVPSPNVGASNNALRAVAAVSPDDIWAVGSYLHANSGSVEQTLIEHWDGSSWNVVPSPNAGTDNYLKGVAAVSGNDVWAVGYYHNGGIYQTLTLHWNGTAWGIVPSPNPTMDSNYLYDVTAVSTEDVWAVGYSSGAPSQTFSLHWNGSAWNLLLSPSPGTASNRLYAVEALATDNIWAVGYCSNSSVGQTLIVHWNGSTWSTVASPNAGTDGNILNEVEAIAANDVWAVGSYHESTADRTLIEHWDGNAWSVVSSPNASSDDNYLNSVAAVSATDVWAVGTHSPDATAQTLVERYNPCVCPSNFTDVPSGSTFYSYVHCMACQGIINGYSSGCETGNPCFRPNNNVTRGQLSKIVTNAAGFNEPADAQQYQDVPTDSTFFPYIWRLTTRGIVNGYACGGGVPPGSEPCIPPGNLPYFRPNNTATRGQISKIVVSAAGLPAPPPGQITFEDVAQGSTFYEYIEALATSGAISGYPCGGAGQPCVPPENRPYFRPNFTVTRGQSSKIVANVFFPACNAPSSGSTKNRQAGTVVP